MGAYSMHLEPSEVSLTLAQTEHVARLRSILSRERIAWDLSMMGRGKTFTTTALARDMGFQEVIVVAPVSVRSKWEQMVSRYGLPISDTCSLLSYAALRCGGNKEKLFERCYRGALVVFDECQHLKNCGAQTQAAKELITAAWWSASRVLLLSGSPIDQRGHVMTFLDLMGVLPRRRGVFLSQAVQGTHVPTHWLRGFITNCLARDAAATRRVVAECAGAAVGAPWRPAAAREIVYQLFQQVYKPSVRSAITAPASAGASVLKYNCFFTMPATGAAREALERGMASLQWASGYDAATGALPPGAMAGHEALLAIGAALVLIEGAKVGVFAAAAAARLQRPRGKVVIAVNYTSTLRALMRDLAAFQPMQLRGAMTGEQRADVVRRFQEEPGSRLLIANLGVVSTGIDLDDKVGDSPRYCVASPTYSTITLHQLAHRFNRADTCSDAYLHMAYIAGCHEARIVHALASKSRVMRETTPEQAAAGIVFPGDFEALDVDERTHSAASRIAAAWLGYRWRKTVRDNPHTAVGQRWLHMQARRACCGNAGMAV